MGKSLNQLISQICQSLECFSIFHHISTSSNKRTLCETRRSTSMAECFWDWQTRGPLNPRFRKVSNAVPRDNQKNWTRCWRACRAIPMAPGTNEFLHWNQTETGCEGSLWVLYLLLGGKLKEPLFFGKNLFVWTQKFCCLLFVPWFVISIHLWGFLEASLADCFFESDLWDRIQNLPPPKATKFKGQSHHES